MSFYAYKTADGVTEWGGIEGEVIFCSNQSITPQDEFGSKDDGEPQSSMEPPKFYDSVGDEIKDATAEQIALYTGMGE